MATQAPAKPKQTQTVEETIQRLRELYADAPEVGRAALETLIGAMKAAGTGTHSGPQVSQNESSAGRTGLRQGKVSELTALLKLLPGGAERIRAVLDAGRNLRIADRVGTLHDMRYVLIDDDNFLFVPHSELPVIGTTYLDSPASKYRQYRNNFAALAGGPAPAATEN